MQNINGNIVDIRRFIMDRCRDNISLRRQMMPRYAQAARVGTKPSSFLKASGTIRLTYRQNMVTAVSCRDYCTTDLDA